MNHGMPKLNQQWQQEMCNTLTNPGMPNSSQLPCHKDLNTLTNHRTPKSNQQQQQEMPNTSMNPRKLKLSQMQHHEGPNASTNHKMLKSNQQQHQEGLNGSGAAVGVVSEGCVFTMVVTHL